MTLPIPVRAALYAGACLAGVKLASTLRPLNIEGATELAAGGAARALEAVFSGDFGAAASHITGGGGAAASNVKGQVERTIITGVAGGAAAAAFLEWVIS